MTQIPIPTKTQAAQAIDTYDARELIKEGAQACILLDGQHYFLRITRAGKLILTK